MDERARVRPRPTSSTSGALRLADIDGSGTTDIIYLGRDGVRLYFNQSGNRWSDARRLSAVPAGRRPRLGRGHADLLGNGTACLVWSSPLPRRRAPAAALRRPDGRAQAAPARRREEQPRRRDPRPLRAVDAVLPRATSAPAGRGSPGCRSRCTWSSASRPTTGSAATGSSPATPTTTATSTAVEREFRGFGMVEQWDTEEFAAFTEDGTAPRRRERRRRHRTCRRCYTKTWFHTGVWPTRARVAPVRRRVLPRAGLTTARRRRAARRHVSRRPDADEEREACRALKGSMLRQEVYADDGTANAGRPYTVTEQNFAVRCLQRRLARAPRRLLHPRPRERSATTTSATPPTRASRTRSRSRSTRSATCSSRRPSPTAAASRR